MKTKEAVGLKVVFGVLTGLIIVGGGYLVFSSVSLPKISQQNFSNRTVTAEERYLIILKKDSNKTMEQIEQELVGLGLKVELGVQPYVFFVKQLAGTDPRWQKLIQAEVFKVTKDEISQEELNSYFGQDLNWLASSWSNFRNKTLKMAAEGDTTTDTSLPEDFPIDTPVKAGKSAQKAGDSIPFDFQDIMFGPMRGKIGVKVFFVESATNVTTRNGGNASGRGTETWQDRYKIDEIASRIIYGHQFWLDKADLNNVDLSFNFQFFTPFNGNADLVTIPYEPINCNVAGNSENVGIGACDPTNKCCETEWTTAMLNNLDSHYGINTTDESEINIWRRLQKHHYNFMSLDSGARFDRVYTIFVVNSTNDPDQKFPDGHNGHAFMTGGLMVIFFNQNNPDSAIGGPIHVLTSSVTAHEVGHIFNAFDEYKQSSCSCDESWNNCANSSCEVSRDTIEGIVVSRTCLGKTILPESGCIMNSNFIKNWGSIIPTFENPCEPTKCHIGWICPDQGQATYSSPFSAKALNVTSNRQSLNSYICPTWDEDWYQFQVSSAGNIKLTLSSPVGFLDNLSLFDSSGNNLLRNEDSQYTKIINQLIQPGTYYIRIYGQKTGVIDQHRGEYITNWDRTNTYQLDYSFDSGVACADCYVPVTCSQ